ncbi:MAG TPA: prepilin-type N-terminal cleavage/methylation domain-containing protein [Parvularculaceae bacterium]|nr:prepilin-type N-terminal cleavage/methylation domain-containing protein [Parvularculaceae bacterium]
MCVKLKRGSQRGFSLTEVLIAAIIAAGVLAVTARSISVSVHLARATGEHNATIAAALTIADRLRAGMSDEDALLGFGDWRIQRTPLATGDRTLAPYFDKAFIANRKDSSFEFEILVRRSAEANT